MTAATPENVGHYLPGGRHCSYSRSLVVEAASTLIQATEGSFASASRDPKIEYAIADI
jgi:hypothetical protein